MHNFIVLSAVFVTYMCFVEGQSSCKTPNGITGICKAIRDCKPLLVLMLDIINRNNKNPAHVEFLNKSQCGFQDIQPKVCCPPEDTKVEDCFTSDGKIGKCVDIRQCKHVAEMLRPPVSQQSIAFVQNLKCFGQTEYSVCCRYDTVSNTSTQAPQSCITLSALPPNPSTGCCGMHRPTTNKIVGVKETELDEYPWLALIEYKTNIEDKHLCSGTLISGRYVLTAAHCVTGEIVDYATPINVILGEYNKFSDGPDCVEVELGIDCTDEPLVIPIQRAIPHPNYNSTTLKNDIALIRLTTLAPFTDFIRPICLPQMDLTLKPLFNLTFYEAAWARASKPNVSKNVKMHMIVPFVNKKQCRIAHFSPYGTFHVEDTNVCAGGVFGEVLCVDTAGGPLMYKSGGTFEIFGVTSFGHTFCGYENLPKISTKVIEYRDWILKTIQIFDMNNGTKATLMPR